MGDLVLTCTGDLSRNRQVGLRLASGQKLLDILGEMKMVAEGVKTTEAVQALCRKLGVEMPITEQVYAILYENKDPSQAVRDLMNLSATVSRTEQHKSEAIFPEARSSVRSRLAASTLSTQLV